MFGRQPGMAAMRFPLSSVRELWLFIRRLTKNSKEDLLITSPIGPHEVPATFLVSSNVCTES